MFSIQLDEQTKWIDSQETRAAVQTFVEELKKHIMLAEPHSPARYYDYAIAYLTPYQAKVILTAHCCRCSTCYSTRAIAEAWTQTDLATQIVAVAQSKLVCPKCT